MIAPDGRLRVRHCWVKVNASDAFTDPQAPGVIVKWAQGRNNRLWYAYVIHLPDGDSIVGRWYPYTQLTPVEPR